MRCEEGRRSSGKGGQGKRHRNRYWMIALAAAGVTGIQGLVHPGSARGQTTLYWDTNGNTPGAGGPNATGTWNTTNTNWNLNSNGSGSTTSWVDGAVAVFSAGTDATGTFNVQVLGGTGRTIGGLTFEEGQVSISGNALTLANNATFMVGAGLTATINSNIANAGFDLTKAGNGTLVLGGSSDAVGNMVVSAGDVNIDAGSVSATHFHLTDANGVLSNAALSTTGFLFVGDGTKESTFTQSSGTLSPAAGIIVGWGGSSGGQYNLSGGTVSMAGGTLTVGAAGHGTVAQTGGSVNAGTVWVGQGLGVYSLSGTGSLLVNVSESIGVNSGVGTFDQSGGTHTVSGGDLYIGNGVGSSGTYLLSSTGVLNASGQTAWVGYDGTGNFQQSGGTFTAANIELGVVATGNGSYSLSGGSLGISSSLIVGSHGGGTMTHIGGTMTTPSLYLGYNSDGHGAYSLSNFGILTVSGNEYIGNSGPGTFTQSGGTHTNSGGSLYVGNGGIGVYNLSAGTLNMMPTSAYFAVGSSAPGVFNLSGSGNLSIQTANDSIIGWDSAGTMNQTGGTATVTNALKLGFDASGVGNYSLSGAGSLLSVSGGFTVGWNGSGTATQSGGTASVTNSSLILGLQSGSSGVYTLSGGRVSIQGGNAIVGSGGAGTFNQSGGTLSCNNTLTLAQQSGSTGIYNLTGGLLSPSNLVIGGNGSAATLSQSVGTVTTNSLTIALNSGHSGTYNLNSGTSTIFGVVSVGFQGAGTMIQSGGTQTISNDLRIGELAGSSGYYSLSGTGSVSIPNGNNLYVGEHGLGTFVQSGGSISLPAVTNVGGNMYLAFNTDANGSYTVSGGTISADGIVVGGAAGQAGGAATFTASGGTITLASGMHVWPTGQLTLNGGTINAITPSTSFANGGIGALQSGAMNLSAMDDSGTFTQSGGALTVTPGTQVNSGQVSIGNPSTLGTYTISAGTASFDKIGVGGQSFAAPGKGVMNVNGGTVTATTSLFVWDQPGSAVDLAGGVLNVGTLDTNGNSSRFNWSSGTLGITGPLGLTIAGGAPIGSSVSVNASKALYVTTGALTLGNAATFGNAAGGSLTQTGGVVSVAGNLEVDGGSIFMGNYSLGGTGSLTVGNTEFVGDAGGGVFTQSGGTNTALFGMTIGSTSNGSGTYNLSSGQLNVTGTSTLANMGNAVFNQSGGTHTVSDAFNYFIGFGATGSGQYNLGSTGVLQTGTTWIGYDGSGTVVQNGGTFNFENLVMGADAGSSGIYQISGGTLQSVNTSIVIVTVGNSGGATFTQSGGNVSLNNLAELAIGAYSGSNGVYNISGGTLSVGLGNISFAPNSGATASMTVSGTGTVNVTNGYGISLNGSGVGSITQTGGSVSLAGPLLIGGNSANMYNFNAGTLSAGSIDTGSNAARFNWLGGTLNVTNSTLTIGSTGPLGAALTLNPPRILNVTKTTNIAADGTLTLVAGSTLTTGSLSGPGTLVDNSTFQVGSDGTTTTFSGPISGSGGINMVGPGTLVLSGTNAYTGKNTISGGGLSFLGTSSLGVEPNLPTPDYFTISNGGALQLDFTSTLNPSTSFSSSNRGITIGSGGGTIDVVGSNSASNFGGVTGTATLTKVGTGAFNLRASNGNFGGKFVVSQGELNLNLDANLGTASANDVVTLAGGTLGLSQSIGSLFITANHGITLSGQGHVTLALSNQTFTFGAGITGTGTLNKDGAGTLVLGGSGTYAGATNINAGTLKLNAAERIPDTSALTVASGATFNMNGFSENVGSLAGGGQVQLSGTLGVGLDGTNSTFSGALVGTAPFNKLGLGTLVLTSTNTRVGSTTISGGTIQVQADGALGSGSGGTTVSNGATLAFAGNVNYTTAEPLTVNGSGALRNPSGNNSFAGNITLNSDSTFTADNGSLTLNGGINKNGFNLHFAGAGTHNVNGVISGVADVFVDGSGTTNFKNANTYVGPTSVIGGTLALRNPNAIPNNSNISVSAAGTLLLFNTPTTLTGTVNNAGLISLNNVTLNFNNNVTNTGNINVPAGSTVNFNANYAQTGGGAIGGAGDFVVPGAINYNGPNNHPITNVDNPTLAVWSGTGAISIAAGSNFNDAGSFSAGADQLFAASSGNASFTIPANGSLSRGGSITGTTTFASNISLNNSGTVSVSAGNLKLLSSGTHTGSFSVAANTTLEFAGGSNTLSAGNSAATGSGTLLASAGNLSAPALKVDNYTLQVTNTANFSVNTTTVVGGNSGNNGSYNQSGGIATVGILALGNSGNPTSLTGGTGHAVVSGSAMFNAGTILMGNKQAGASSSDLTVSSGGHVFVGGGAQVTQLTVTDGFFEVLNQTAPAGEDVNLAQALVAGYTSDGSISVSGSGGTIISPKIKLGIASGFTGTFNQSGGTVSIAGDSVNGPGVFAAGNNADEDSNSASSGAGHISISGGSLYADTVILGSPNGGQGDFTVSGNAAVTIGGGFKANALIMNGGSLLVKNQDMPGEDPVLNRAIVGGYLNDGAVTVNAGTVFTPKLKLGITSGKTGTYTQSGGSVTIMGDATNGPGVFAGGNDASLTNGSGIGHATISGGTFYADTVLLGSTSGGSADFTVSGNASVTIGGGFKANALIVNGGTFQVLNQNPPTGEDPVLNRSIVGGYMTDGGVTVNGGTLSAPKIKMGITSGKVGTYSQTGGNVSIVGDNTNGPGTFSAGNDASLTSGSGIGHATISGGTFYADTVLLGSSSGGQGDFTVSGNAAVTIGGGFKANALIMNGGSLQVMDQNPVNGEDPELNRSIVAGYATDGGVAVNAGTVISPNIKLGITSGKTGTYTQIGGSVTATNFAVGNDPLTFSASGNGQATISGGTLSAGAILLGSNSGGGSGALTISGTASVTSSSTQVTGHGSIALNGGSLNAGALQIQSGGTFTQAGGTLAMASLSNAGTFAFNGGNLSQTGAVMSLGNLSLTGTKNYSMVSGHNKALVLSGVTIGASNTLDLNDDALILNYSASDTTHSTRDTIRNLLKNGRNAGAGSPGAWNGLGGIVSSFAHNNGNGFNLAIGYGDNEDIALVRGSGSYTSFGGQTVASNTVLIQMTRGADATLDGVVDAQDVTILGSHFNKPNSGQWVFGDFDYSGTCDATDVTTLGSTFGKTTPTLSPAQMTAEFGSAFTQAFEGGQTGAVPEPGSLTLIGLGGIGLIGARRRRRRRYV